MEVKEKVLDEKSSQDVERIRKWKQNPKENDVSLLKSKTAREVSYSLKTPDQEKSKCLVKKKRESQLKENTEYCGIWKNKGNKQLKRLRSKRHV